MKFNKLIASLCGVTSVFSAVGYTEDFPQVLFVNAASTSFKAPSQDLVSALGVIGASSEDIATLQSSGKPATGLVKAVTAYDNNSGGPAYQNITQEQDDALVSFSYTLYNQKLISSDSIQKLMQDEKLRAGMNQDQIDRLASLTKKMQADPKFALTEADMGQVDKLASLMSQYPFAFADTLGPLTGALIYNSQQGNITVSQETESHLITAAQGLAGLSDKQVDNLGTISNTYNTNNTFETSETNVDDMNQALATAQYPSGEAILYPLVGVSSAVAVGAIAAAYNPYFYGAEYWHGDEVNNAWNDRQDNINQAQDNAGDREQNRSGNQSNRQGNRDENQTSRQGPRQSDASSAQGASQGRQQARQSGASSAQGASQSRQQARGSSLNRDNSASRGGNWSGGSGSRGSGGGRSGGRSGGGGGRR